ncbi:MAG TPA: TPM domain-containing protein [Bacteroidia bacterium]|jgi:uncharacterized membrane protein|nr:TPM domain-containing protein [Bacteroidia bacterium]
MKAADFFTLEEKEAIRKAIADAERLTSGEIRVHVENKCRGESIDRAQRVFGKLKMHKTKQRNGILFYLAVESKVFAVYGDQGIHEKVKDDFWKALSTSLENDFKHGRFADGLIAAIKECGSRLHHYFPLEKHDRNELSDEINFG